MTNELNQHLPYPKTDEIAEERFWKYKGKDPFPLIKPALLNSADIADYAAQTGMISPFDSSRLGPASYEMVLGGEYLYWDDEEKQFSSTEIKENEPLVLRKNSITYVSVQETFRIPDYIALRFNLRVRHVHRGLLLGTGPLIDPGFHGKIMIPIHNLTSNEYIVYGGEDLISVEFTKVSPNEAWKIPEEERLNQMGEYVRNSGKNSKKPFGKLLKDALPIGIGKVVSSLSSTLAEAKKHIKEARTQIENNENLLSWYRKISIWAGVALIIALLGLLFTTYSVISDANKYVSDASMFVKKYEKEDIDLRNFVIRDEVDIMKSKISQLIHAIGPEKKLDLNNVVKRNELDALKKEIEQLNEKIDHFIESQRVPVEKNTESH